MEIPYRELYKKAILIRFFENRLLELFSEGKLFGTTHTYVGQEAVAISSISHLKKEDVVFSNHRCHGHYLAKENDPKSLLAEIMGKNSGACGGRGGSQHISRNNFFSNGIQGGILPNALGMAFAEKFRRSPNIVVVFIGDGTLGEGSTYESMNLASLWKVPLLIVLENNQYAQTTSVNDNLAGEIIDRAKSFGIKSNEVKTNDVSELYPLFGRIINNMRQDGEPFFQLVNTYRINAHSKGDDFRDKKEIDFWKKKDPLIYFKNFLSEQEINKISKDVMKNLKEIEKETKDTQIKFK